QSNSQMSSNPFVSSPHGHPSFNPVKLGSRGTPLSDSRLSKPPKPPDKPLMPYMRYSRKVWDQVRARNPSLKLWEVGKLVGQLWRDLPPEEKQEYFDEYEAEKNVISFFTLRVAYFGFSFALKNFGKVNATHVFLKGFQSPQKQGDGKVSIQGIEEEEDPDEFSIKHVAAARYLRNHRLINEIFGDTVVPDVRSVVTTTRMQVLKRQVQSLTMHQKKLEAELLQIEEKFEAKKRKFLEASEAFQEEMKKRCSMKPVDNVTFQKMVEKAYETLKKEQQAREEQAQRRKEEEEKQAIEAAQASAPIAIPANSDDSHEERQTFDSVSASVEKSEDSSEPVTELEEKTATSITSPSSQEDNSNVASENRTDTNSENTNQ
ncbi:SWI/SNF-related matrix-associated actin-dependent regulator of chromatin subfamily E member 1-like protein, partial [Dinothrombium tinctorium]